MNSKYFFFFFLASPVSSPIQSVQRQIPRNSPCCTALYDFEAENPGELGFKVCIITNDK